MWGAVVYRPPHHLGCRPSDETAQDRGDAGDRDESQDRGAEAALTHHRVTSVLQASPTSSAGASARARSSCQPCTSPADTRAVNDMTAPIRKAQASVARMVGPGWRW